MNSRTAAREAVKVIDGGRSDSLTDILFAAAREAQGIVTDSRDRVTAAIADLVKDFRDTADPRHHILRSRALLMRPSGDQEEDFQVPRDIWVAAELNTAGPNPDYALVYYVKPTPEDQTLGKRLEQVVTVAGDQILLPCASERVQPRDPGWLDLPSRLNTRTLSNYLGDMLCYELNLAEMQAGLASLQYPAE